MSVSLAVTHDIAICFLFLSILRCFNSRRSPLREAIAVGIPIRRSQVLPLRAGPLGLSQLGTSVIGSRAERSTSWHSSHVRRIVVTRERVQWTPGLHVHTVSSARRSTAGLHQPFPPTLARSGASVIFGIRSLRRLPLKGHGSRSSPERWTHWDSNPGHPPCKGGTLPLSYGPTPSSEGAYR